MWMGFLVLPFKSWIGNENEWSLPAKVTYRGWNHKFESWVSCDNHFHNKFWHRLHPPTFEPAVKTFNKQFITNQLWKWHYKNIFCSTEYNTQHNNIFKTLYEANINSPHIFFIEVFILLSGVCQKERKGQIFEVKVPRTYIALWKHYVRTTL